MGQRLYKNWVWKRSAKLLFHLPLIVVVCVTYNRSHCRGRVGLSCSDNRPLGVKVLHECGTGWSLEDQKRNLLYFYTAGRPRVPHCSRKTPRLCLKQWTISARLSSIPTTYRCCCGAQHQHPNCNAETNYFLRGEEGPEWPKLEARSAEPGLRVLGEPPPAREFVGAL